MSNDQNAKANVLTALASGDIWAKLATIGLIIVSGGSNFLETRTGNRVNEREIQRATDEIHQLYPKLMQAIQNQNKLMDDNAIKLRNQTLMLENQRHQLQILEEGQRRFFGTGTEHP